MKACIEKVQDSGIPCNNCDCSSWINYKEDLNCTYVAINRHGPMKLNDIAKRLQLTAARIKQIESKIFDKISKRLKVIDE